MLKWIDLMDSHQDAGDGIGDFLTGNLFKETQCLRDWLESGKWEIESSIPPFTGENYVRHLSDEYLSFLGVDRQTVIDWIDDPDYHKLMRVSGVQTDVLIPEFMRKTLIKNISTLFPIHWDTAEIRLFVQNPGDMFPLHYDRFKSYDHDLALDQESRVRRWLIMLYDQKPGQCFFMNNHSLHWHAGDVVDWEQTAYHHGSANFGYHPRFSVRLTGKLNHNTKET